MRAVIAVPREYRYTGCFRLANEWMLARTSWNSWVHKNPVLSREEKWIPGKQMELAMGTTEAVEGEVSGERLDWKDSEGEEVEEGV